MKAKRKPSRRDRSKQLLREKALFILFGANGGFEMRYFEMKPGERGEFPAEVGLDVFGRWLGAIQKHLKFASDAQRTMIAKPSRLIKYSDFDAAVEWLHGIGVRA